MCAGWRDDTAGAQTNGESSVADDVWDSLPLAQILAPGIASSLANAHVQRDAATVIEIEPAVPSAVCAQTPVFRCATYKIG